jgi:sodium-dependent phosphate cotransporter
VVLGSSDALSVVLASMLSVTLVSLVILLLFFRRYERAMLSLVEWATATNRNVAFFMVAIMVTPLVLLLI